jgi:choline dehydrogenase
MSRAPVLLWLSGVGKNMQDHYAARVSYPVVGAQTANERSRGLPLDRRCLSQGVGGGRRPPICNAPLPRAASRAARSALEETPGLSAGAWQMRPLSRGYVEAKSNRPGDMPAINPRYLSEEADRRAIIGGLRMARRIFAAPPLKQFVREETLPGNQIQSDDELLDYARRNGGTCYHASCTCLMGSHAMAVVDDDLKVHGLEGLRVIDASVMPAVTSTNTNAPTIMIAEKGAAIIKGAARQRLAA